MEKAQPNYLKRIYTILVIVAVTTLICLASGIIFPLILAFIIAILIRPIDRYLQNRLHIPKAVSILMTLIVSLAFMLAILMLLGIQLRDFVDDLPQIEKNISKIIQPISDWITQEFDITQDQQAKMMKDNIMKGNMLSLKSFGSLTHSLLYLILIPIYIFLFLFYRLLLITFLLKLVSGNEEEKMRAVVDDIKVIVRKYILGLLIEMVAVAALTTLGFWAIGVKYALFLGIMTGLLNLIPYVGILVANVLSCLMALSTSNDVGIVLGVLGIMAAVQLIDNNLLLPGIVGSKVRINALASIVSVIVGGTLAGVPGMFLAIPITAIIKVVFDSLPHFQPYGYLLGDVVPTRVFWKKSKL